MLDSAAVPDKTSYRDSGVDIDAQDEALREVRRIARGTFTPNVISDIGSFGGLFRAQFEGISKPVLVSSTDGVGTKLRVAQAMKIHDTVGYDQGDHLITTLARAIAESLRGQQVAARMGGDEFIVILPDATAKQARKLERSCRRG